MMSMALYLLNKDDERYQDLPDWDRDSNWHFFVGDQHFRYPKAWEPGAIASIAERTAEKVINEDPLGLGKDFTRILGSVFHVNLTPQILAPLVEQATNRNSFTNAPIQTPGMENMQPFLRAKPTTSETLKAAGMLTKDMPEALQVNPVRAEALLRGYFNTWAMYGLMLTDKAMFGDKLPEMRTDQLPVVRRFYSQEPPPHTKFETQFYDMLGEAKRLHGSLRELDHLGLPDIADAKEKEPLATETKPLERAAKNLSGINKDMLAVRRSDATPEEKRQKLDALTVERNALLKAAVQESKAAQTSK
ncbi:MAG: LPD38 domain-containing protein [Rhodocyclaceae bacterium]